MLDILNGLIGGGSALFFGALAVTSYAEKEIRAAKISLAFACIALLLWLSVIPAAGAWANGLAVLGLAAAGLISLIPFFPGAPAPRQVAAAAQYDERDTMFARNNIQHYPELMDAYYEMRPENLSTDRQIHKKPEFGDPRQVFHDDYAAPLYDAAFGYLARTIPLSDGEPFPEKKEIDPERFAGGLSDMIRFYGGCGTGIIPMAAHHYYSHKGRHAENWGKVPDQSYPTAIVIVVPMRTEMIKQGPTSCVIQESSQKYVEAAKISNIIAGYIRQFGYRARAHNDANYDTLCVPLAVESGLGELGRMGIFMHKTHGPCVRLAVVTTDLELPATAPDRDLHMESFCRICKKCADNCPSGSITRREEQNSRGFRHWSIDQAQCFSYWKTIGSDCGMCISVCPYTKPDTFIHKLVRFYISRNILNQHVALLMDDLLYGRKKALPKTNPDSIFRT
ncbi:MAG: 4Fe-4S dicluster domain-containing protein [Desulfobacterales bacterium]|nr:4Fe-4S dicluster domain-containing protein [Desulfobacterales bacterium]